ncbi:MAG: hypothetical protein ACXVP2_12760, partial [Tumebacillaceae bacterium]
KSHLEMLQFILDGNTEVSYPPVTRSRFEVRNGYKEAVKRGAKLSEIEVFNLLFHFKGRLRVDGVALMCHGPQGQEWIMLCPCDTSKLIQIESRRYQSVASRLVLQGKMDSDFHNVLLHNLRLLVPGTRCANTLLHEYGHVLQHRIWASEGILASNVEMLYNWFEKIGYVNNVEKRIPNLNDKSPEDINYYLKESFVEDYRIGLNMSSMKGKFEFPNAFCFLGDFLEPSLMHKGVTIVKNVVNQKRTKKNENMIVVEYEPDRIAIADEIMKHADGFDPRKVQITEADRQAVRDRMAAYQKLRLV